jgi:hypothetical protein
VQKYLVSCEYEINPFPAGKERPGRDADHSLPFSAEVKNEWELYYLYLKRLHGV